MTFKIISIEGNIGAGKTTLFNHLQEENKDETIVFIREPVDIWESFKDRNGNSIISKFYENPRDYSLSFQMMAFSTRLKLLKNTIKNNPQAKLFICERSLETDCEIFAKMLHDDGYLDDIMYKVYLECFKNAISLKYHLSGVIYVNSNAILCLNRIIQRNREGESNISIEYLDKCHLFHKLWFAKSKFPVLEINSNFNQHIEYMIYRFLQKILIQ